MKDENLDNESIKENANNEIVKKDNKVIKIILYIAILVIAIGGIIIATIQDNYKLKDKYNDKDNETNIVENNNDNIDTETNDDNETNEDVTTTEENKIFNIDKLLEKTKIEVTKEDRIDLINSSNCNGAMNEKYVGEMFREEISDEYKLLYTLSAITSEVSNQYYEESSDMWGNTITISKTNLLKYAHLYFKDVTIPESIDANLYYRGVSELNCNFEKCTFNVTTFGLTGYQSEYVTKITDSDEKIQIKYLYREWKIDDETQFIAKIYDKKNGNLKKEITFTYEEEVNEKKDMDLFQYYNPSLSVEYTFDENNALVSVKRLDK